MSEGIPQFEKAKMTREAYIHLAEKLSQRTEGLPFFGIESGVYTRIKKSEEEYPGYSTPIDELVKRFEIAGMKIVLGKNPQSGNVFIVPADSENLEDDAIPPHQLAIHDDMDPELKELILASREK